MKRFLLSILCCLMAVVSGYAEEEVTLSFADNAQRTEYSTTCQVWKQNGVILTNNKSNSTNDVADYVNPARFYANSKIVIECSLGNITKIVFDCNSSKYATALQNSIGSSAKVSSDKVTVTLDGTSKIYTIASLTAQVRMDALTVTYAKANAGEVSIPDTPTLTSGGNFVGSKEIEISCTTDKVDIYYTTDGTEPTVESEVYNTSFTIEKTTTVKAIAVNEAGVSGIAMAEYTRVAASPEIKFNGEATFENSIEVTIDIAEGTTAYYTLNDKEPNQNSEECPETLTLKADATLQVIAYEGAYVSPIVKQKFTLKASGNSGSGGSSSTATLVEDAANLKVGDQVVIVATAEDFALSTNQKSNNRGHVAITRNGNDVTLNKEVQTLTLEVGTKTGTFAFYTGNGYLYAASSSANHLKTKGTKDVNGSWSIDIENSVATIKAPGSSNRNWLRYNSDSELFSCYSSGQTDISLYKVNLATIEDYVLSISAAGWATLYLGHAVTIPSGVTCYAISSIEDGELVLDELTDVIPASTGVLVKADEGEYTFKVTEVLDEVVNLLTGTTKNEYITEGGYVLSMVDGEVGLYKAKMAGSVFLNNANKAYLPASAVPETVQGANGFKFRFETTGVEGVQVAEGVKVIFDLSGRKVNDMKAPGLYIVNGKKVLVK